MFKQIIPAVSAIWRGHGTFWNGKLAGRSGSVARQSLRVVGMS